MVNQKSLKIEGGLLIVGLIFYFLLLKSNFSSLIYILYVLGMGIYFFPVKIIIQRNHQHLLWIILSCFIISTCVTLSYVSYVLGNDIGNFLKITLLILTLGNLFVGYKLLVLKNKLYLLHIFIAFLISMTFFK